MTEWEAVQKRISIRAYKDQLIEPEKLEQLRAYAEKISEESGQDFRLFTSEEIGKPVIKMSAAMFSGPVYTFVSAVGGREPVDAEKIGYYGEDLVLFATQLGLGTCWVHSTYESKSIDVPKEKGQRLWDVITIGYARDKVPTKQKMMRKMVRRSDRKLEEFLESDVAYEEAPEWIRQGIEAIFLGPSAVNQQPVNIVYKDGEASARIWKKGNGLEHNDLGIAKKQFEVGAAAAGHPGRFAWGDGGVFE